MYATNGGSTPCFSMTAAISGDGDPRVDIIAATSATSADRATELLPSSATWSTTFVPPSAPTASARSALKPSHFSTSATPCVITILGMEAPSTVERHGPTTQTTSY